MYRTVSLGGPAFFLAVGLVLMFAVPDTVLAGIELYTVGLIVTIISGVVLLVAAFQATRGTRTTRAVHDDPRTGDRVEETRSNL